MTVPVVFIGGFGRSGSTLVERVLGQVPGHVAVGELVHLPQRGLIDDDRCGCGKAFSDCPFWTDVGEAAFGGWRHVAGWRDLQLEVDRKRYLPDLIAPWRSHHQRHLQLHAERLGRVYQAIAEVSGARVVVDSSKHVQTAFLLRHVPGISPRVVHLVRDSRGVAYSWTKEVARPETDEGELMARYRPTAAAAQYLAYNVLFHGLGLVSTPEVFLRYESFLADPPGELRRLLRRLDLPDGVPSLGLEFLSSDHVELAPNHSVAGNPMRFRTGGMELRRDDEWRTRLPAGQRRAVTAITAPLLATYGYLRPER